MIQRLIVKLMNQIWQIGVYNEKKKKKLHRFNKKEGLTLEEVYHDYAGEEKILNGSGRKKIAISKKIFLSI